MWSSVSPCIQTRHGLRRGHHRLCPRADPRAPEPYEEQPFAEIVRCHDLDTWRRGQRLEPQRKHLDLAAQLEFESKF